MSYAWSPLPYTVENRLSLSNDTFVTAELGFLRTEDLTQEQMVRAGDVMDHVPDDIVALKRRCIQLQESLRQSESLRYTIENANRKTAEAALIAQKNLEITEKKRIDLAEQLIVSKRQQEDTNARIRSLLAEDENKNRLIEKLQNDLLSLEDQLRKTQDTLCTTEQSLLSLRNQNKQLELMVRQFEQASTLTLPNQTPTAIAAGSALRNKPVPMQGSFGPQSMTNVQSRSALTVGRRTPIVLPFGDADGPDYGGHYASDSAQTSRPRPLGIAAGTADGGYQRHPLEHGAERATAADDPEGLVSSLLALEDEKRRATASVAALQDELLRTRFQVERAEAERDAAAANARAARAAADSLRESLQESESARLSQEATARSATPISAGSRSDAVAAQEEIAALLRRLRETAAQRDAAERRVAAQEKLQRQMQEVIDRHALEAVAHANQMDMLATQSDFLAGYVRDVHEAKEAVEARLADTEARLADLSAYYMEGRACQVLGRITSFIRLWRRFAAACAWQAWSSYVGAHHRRRLGIERGRRRLYLANRVRPLRFWMRAAASERYERYAASARTAEEEMQREAEGRLRLSAIAEEARRMHERAVIELSELRSEEAARRIRAFLRFWMGAGMRRAWNKWRACAVQRAVQKQRRFRLLRIVVRKMRGGNLSRSFSCWIDQVLEARERALAEGAARAHEEQLRAVFEERAAQDARIAALQALQQNLLQSKDVLELRLQEVAQDKERLLAATHEHRINLAAQRTWTFLQYWKNAPVLRAWNKWRDCTWTRAGIRRRRLHFIRINLRKLLRGATAGCFATWVETLHTARAATRRTEADTALQELLVAREERMAAEEHAAALRASQERMEQALREACNRSDSLALRLEAAVLEREGLQAKLEEQRVNLAVGRTFAFLRFWKNAGILKAWNKFKASVGERASRKRRHLHLLRLGLHRMRGCILQEALENWLECIQLTHCGEKEGTGSNYSEILTLRGPPQRRVGANSTLASSPIETVYPSQVTFGARDPTTDLWLLKNQLEIQLAASERVQCALKEESECFEVKISALNADHEAKMQSMKERLNRSFDANIELKQAISMLQANADEAASQNQNLMLQLLEKDQKLKLLELENSILIEKMADHRAEHEQQLQSVLLMADEGFSHYASRDSQVELLKAELASERIKTDQLQDRLDASRKMTEEARYSLYKLQEKFKEVDMFRDQRLQGNSNGSEKILSGQKVIRENLKHSETPDPLQKVRYLKESEMSAEKNSTSKSKSLQTGSEESGSLLPKILHVSDPIRCDGMPSRDGIEYESFADKLFILDHLRCLQEALLELAERLKSQPLNSFNSTRKRQDLELNILNEEIRTWKADIDILRLEAKLEGFQDL